MDESFTQTFNEDRSDEIFEYIALRASEFDRAFPYFLEENDFDRQRFIYARAVNNIINYDDPYILTYLNDDALMHLLHSFGDYPGTDHLKEAFIEEVQTRNLDSYQSWMEKREDMLISQITGDEELLVALSNWDDLPFEDRLFYMQSLAHLDANIRGYDAPEIRSEPLESSFGEYYSTNNRVFIDTDHLLDQNALNVLQTLYHETEHAFQTSLAQKFSVINKLETRYRSEITNGLLEPTQEYYAFMSQNLDTLNLDALERDIYDNLLLHGSLRTASIAFYYNADVYVLPDVDLDAYLDQPKEAAARLFEQRIRNGISDDVDAKTLEKSISKFEPI